MKQCQGELLESVVLSYPKKIENPSLEEIIRFNFDLFFQYLSKINLVVKHKEQTTNMQNNSSTQLIFPIQCFKVDFNDSFVTITAIKKR